MAENEPRFRSSGPHYHYRGRSETDKLIHLARWPPGGGVPDCLQDLFPVVQGVAEAVAAARATTAGPCRRPIPRRGVCHQLVGTRAGHAARGRPGCVRAGGGSPSQPLVHSPGDALVENEPQRGLDRPPETFQTAHPRGVAVRAADRACGVWRARCAVGSVRGRAVIGVGHLVASIRSAVSSPAGGQRRSSWRVCAHSTRQQDGRSNSGCHMGGWTPGAVGTHVPGGGWSKARCHACPIDHSSARVQVR